MIKYSVYCIINNINNKKYIGITQQTIEERFQQHIKESNNDSDRCLCRAIRKYGKENFSIELLDDSAQNVEELKQLEQKYIEIYDTHAWLGYGYNMTFGGDGSWGRECSKETREKISKSNKGKTIWQDRIHPFKDKKQSVESNIKRSNTLKGRVISQETLEKRKLYWDGVDRSGENNPNYGRKHSEETKKKMSENCWMKTEKGKTWAKEQGLLRSGENNPNYGKKWSKEYLEIFKERSSGGNNPKAQRAAILDKDYKIIGVYSCRKDIVGFEGITEKQLTTRIKKQKPYKEYMFVILTQGEYEYCLNNIDTQDVYYPLTN